MRSHLTFHWLIIGLLCGPILLRLHTILTFNDIDLARNRDVDYGERLLVPPTYTPGLTLIHANISPVNISIPSKTTTSVAVIALHDNILDPSRNALLLRVFEMYAERASKLLDQKRGGMFDSIEVAYPLSPLIFQTGDGNTRKGMLNPELAFANTREDCVVYGLGISNDASFEDQLSQFCRQVHAFDCTIGKNNSAVAGHPFTFHDFCIGEKPAAGNGYFQEPIETYKYSTLESTMRTLGHETVDILKMDIEGAEWGVLEKILEDMPVSKLPKQLIFELHTACANPEAVPPTLVAGRDADAVRSLFKRLVAAGYRVLEKSVNPGDGCCSEFVLILA